MHISNARSAGGNVPGGPNLYPKPFYLLEYVFSLGLYLNGYWGLCFFLRLLQFLFASIHLMLE